MHCQCGSTITKYRIAGAMLSWDELDQKENFGQGYDLFYHRTATLCKAFAICECKECGEIRFFNIKSKILEGMKQLKNLPLMEEFDNATAKE